MAFQGGGWKGRQTNNCGKAQRRDKEVPAVIDFLDGVD